MCVGREGRGVHEPGYGLLLARLRRVVPVNSAEGVPASVFQPRLFLLTGERVGTISGGLNPIPGDADWESEYLAFFTPHLKLTLIPNNATYVFSCFTVTGKLPVTTVTDNCSIPDD